MTVCDINMEWLINIGVNIRTVILSFNAYADIVYNNIKTTNTTSGEHVEGLVLLGSISSA